MWWAVEKVKSIRDTFTRVRADLRRGNSSKLAAREKKKSRWEESCRILAWVERVVLRSSALERTRSRWNSIAQASPAPRRKRSRWKREPPRWLADWENTWKSVSNEVRYWKIEPVEIYVASRPFTCNALNRRWLSLRKAALYLEATVSRVCAGWNPAAVPCVIREPRCTVVENNTKKTKNSSFSVQFVSPRQTFFFFFNYHYFIYFK